MRSPRGGDAICCNSSQTYCCKPGAGVEQHLEPAEEVLPQRRVAAQIRQQHLEALRHVEIDGRRDLLQVAHGGVDGARQRLALVDVERAAVVEHQAEIVVAAEGVVPRQPVDDHRRLVGDEGQARADHRLVRAQHALGVDDALGIAGRAGGEQDFRHRVGTDLGVRCVDRGGRLGREQIGEQRGRPAAGRIGGDHDLDVGRHGGVDGARERLAVGGEHQARRQDLDDRLELAEVARHQRVGHRDRRIGHADHHRGEPEQRVLDVVAGQDRDRPLGRELAVAAAPARCRAPATASARR